MPELYDLQHGLAYKATSARSCAVCGGTANPNTSVFLPHAEVTICRSCGHDIVNSLAPKAESIQVPLATKASSVRKAVYHPFDEKRMAHDIKMDVLTSLLAMSMDK
jgi:ribosome-binding protein aMBF1 (putative translation factor)